MRSPCYRSSRLRRTRRAGRSNWRKKRSRRTPRLPPPGSPSPTRSRRISTRGAPFSPARTQTVLGFPYLAQGKTKDSRIAFEKAIDLDQADPLPRLGLGLATIRDGDVADGRTEIEIAASLDPHNSLTRSYLGKAYDEGKRGKTASTQFAMA